MAGARMSSAERRAELLAVARELFVASGYRGTTTLAVAQRAGVSEALVVKHFGTKENLYRQALAEPVLSMLDADLQGNVDEQDQLVAGTLDEHYESVQEFGEHWASLLAEQGPALAALIKDLHDFPDIAGSLIKLFTDRVNAIADSLVDVANRDDYIGYDVRAATFAAIGAFGVAALAGEDTTEYVAKVTHMLFFGFTSEAGRQKAQHLRDVPPQRGC
jgi:AcrR family transcriptional regulator